MLIKVFSSMLIVAALSGCASTYKQNQTSLDLQRSMDIASAEKVLADSLSSNNHSTGICESYGMFNADARTKIKVTDNAIVVKDAYVRGEKIKQTETFTEYKKRYINTEIPLSKITKVRVQPEGDTHLCSRTKGENILQAFMSTFKWFAFDVKNKDMDKVIASIKILSPNAELVTGMGL